jgi:hypothetical protein
VHTNKLKRQPGAFVRIPEEGHQKLKPDTEGGAKAGRMNVPTDQTSKDPGPRDEARPRRKKKPNKRYLGPTWVAA